jgi:outer membrane protein assembly factor BamA
VKFSGLPVTVCLLLSFAPAQARKPSAKNLPPSAFKLVSVKVTGTSRYQPDDVIRAAGLQLGQPVHDEDLKNVVRLLGESGAFTSVSYSSQFDPEGTKVELKLQDAENFFPAHFDNLVWFTDRDLFDKIHASVPLFDGQLPKDGELAGEVSEALQILLIQKNIAGEVEYLRPGQEDVPVEAFVYSVSGPSIVVRNVEFAGAAPAELELLTKAARRLQGTQYARPAIRALEDKAFLPIFREHGYLKAVLGDPEPTVVQNEPRETQVDVMVKVDPGPQYKLDSLVIGGYKAVPLDVLQAAFHVHPGDVANLVELEKSLETVRKIYGAHGYMGASIKAEARMEDQPPLGVIYTVSIVEGDVYKMGDVEIRGLDSRTTAGLQNDWTLRSGDIYDSSYVGRFVEQAYKKLGDWHVSVHETIDPHDKTVDVTVRFDPDS